MNIDISKDKLSAPLLHIEESSSSADLLYPKSYNPIFLPIFEVHPIHIVPTVIQEKLCLDRKFSDQLEYLRAPRYLEKSYYSDTNDVKHILNLVPLQIPNLEQSHLSSAAETVTEKAYPNVEKDPARTQTHTHPQSPKPSDEQAFTKSLPKPIFKILRKGEYKSIPSYSSEEEPFIDIERDPMVILICNKEHKTQIKYFCINDQLALCEKCSFKHFLYCHDVKHLKDFFMSSVHNLRSLCKHKKRQMKNLVSARISDYNSQFFKLSEELHKRKEKIIKDVEKYLQSLGELLNQSNENHSQIQKVGLNEEVSKLQGIVEVINRKQMSIGDSIDKMEFEGLKTILTEDEKKDISFQIEQCGEALENQNTNICPPFGVEDYETQKEFIQNMYGVVENEFTPQTSLIVSRKRIAMEPIPETIEEPPSKKKKLETKDQKVLTQKSKFKNSLRVLNKLKRKDQQKAKEQKEKEKPIKISKGIEFLHKFEPGTSLLHLITIPSKKASTINIRNAKFLNKLVGYGSVEINHQIFLCGGCRMSKPILSPTMIIEEQDLKVATSKTYEYDFEQQVMKKVGRMMQGRRAHALVKFEKRQEFYAICGTKLNLEEPLTTCERFSLIHSKWKPVPSVMFGHIYPAACSLNSRWIYLFGERDINAGSIQIIDTQRLNRGWKNIHLKIQKVNRGLLEISSYAHQISQKYILILGGFNNSNQAYFVNPTDYTMKKGPTLRFGTQFQNGFVHPEKIGNKIYSIGDDLDIQIFDTVAHKFKIMKRATWV